MPLLDFGIEKISCFDDLLGIQIGSGLRSSTYESCARVIKTNSYELLFTAKKYETFVRQLQKVTGKTDPNPSVCLIGQSLDQLSVEADEDEREKTGRLWIISIKNEYSLSMIKKNSFLNFTSAVFWMPNAVMALNWTAWVIDEEYWFGTEEVDAKITITV